ncbi:hypothetical protein L9F63_011253, partial [Diploptera punctata]
MQTFLIIGSLMVASCLGASSNLAVEIVGGQNAKIQDYPYQLSLEVKGKHTCGASIVTNDYAVTAAHCVYGHPEIELQLRSGTSFREIGGYLHPFDSYNVHPKYKDGHNDYDIAVAKVRWQHEFKYQMQPVPLASENPRIGTLGVVTGYGFVNQDGHVLAAQLQQLQVPIVSNDLCKQVAQGSLTPNMICAGISGGEGACFADSGGPLVVNGALVGVVSFALDKCDKPVPAVYADIPAMLEWIRANRPTARI